MKSEDIPPIHIWNFDISIWFPILLGACLLLYLVRYLGIDITLNNNSWRPMTFWEFVSSILNAMDANLVVFTVVVKCYWHLTCSFFYMGCKNYLPGWWIFNQNACLEGRKFMVKFRQKRKKFVIFQGKAYDKVPRIMWLTLKSKCINNCKHWVLVVYS